MAKDTEPNLPLSATIGAKSVGRTHTVNSHQGILKTMGTWTEKIAALQDKKEYAELNWEGSFDEYLDLVRANPRVTRSAYQRLYDMILSHGKTEYIDNKKKLIRYHFFSDEKNGGRDAVFGL